MTHASPSIVSLLIAGLTDETPIVHPLAVCHAPREQVRPARAGHAGPSAILRWIQRFFPQRPSDA